MHDKPKVSIIMGIYNCEKTLENSINSILEQTYRDWELIMCDDCSTDKTFSIAKKYESLYSNKIKVIHNKKNKGLAYSLNCCLNIAKGEYIARQDGDDISEKTRLYKQVQILDKYHEFGLVSTGASRFDEYGVWSTNILKEVPEAKDVVIGKAFVHAAAMIRKEVYNAVGNYTVSNRTLRVEDLDLWCKIYSLGYKGYNVQESLYLIREDKQAVNRRKYKYRIDSVLIRRKYFAKLKVSYRYYPGIFTPMVVGLIPNKLLLLFKKLKDKNSFK